MKNDKPVIALVGPTSVGKSDVAMDLALMLKTEIISADSRQIYRGMDIGTAKPSLEARKQIVHHMIDRVDPDQRFSAGQFRREAQRSIEGLHRNGKIPIVIGGTGLYLKLLFMGVWEGPTADWVLRERLQKEEAANGPGFLHQELKRFDPESAEKIMPNDVSKIIRAIEVYRIMGQPISVFHRQHRFADHPYQVLVIGLRRARTDLYERIETRVDGMINNGLEEETSSLFGKGYSENLGSMKGLGYRQMGGYLKGRYDRAEAIRLIKRDTRRYAKRQLTWFNRDPLTHWLDLEPNEGSAKTIGKITEFIGRQEEAVHAES